MNNNIPTPEEIKKIALRYALEKSEGVPYDPFEEEYASEFLQWLSKDYCIVEKSKVKEVMKYPQRHTELIQGTMHFQVIGIKKQ